MKRRTLSCIALALFAAPLAGNSQPRKGRVSWGVELVAKRLQVLKELAPAAQRVGILANPDTATPDPKIHAEFEQRLGLKILWVQARVPDEIEASFETLARERAAGLVVLADALFYLHRARIGELCAKSRLPSVWGDKSYLLDGGAWQRTNPISRPAPGVRRRWPTRS